MLDNIKNIKLWIHKKHVISNIWGICRIDWIFTGKILKLLERKYFSDLIKTLKCSIYQKAYYQGI